MAELVSCILATRDRPAFVRQAIRCFLRQTYDHAELIVVDDGKTSVAELCSGLCRVRHVRVEEPMSLGEKLNIGIRHAQGMILQKLDDDDYYHSEFLERAVHSLSSADRGRSVVAWDCFVVLLPGEAQVRFSGHGWAAGGTLCFHREVWERTHFRAVASAVDAWFLQDLQPTIIRVCEPERYILVRHSHNTWRTMNGERVEEYFRRCRVYPKPLIALVEPLDLAFYQSLASGGQEQ
jgi:glycosyltransferase involved in cell wall biosynthesis